MSIALRTSRLTLRDLRPEDFPAIHALRSDPAVARYMDFAPETEAETRAWLAYVIEHNERTPRFGYNLAIERWADGRVLGWIGIGRPSRPSGRFAVELDFGYALRPAYWGRGYMSEALRALLAFAFDELRAEYIFGECDSRNGASARVMEKAGMRYEGLMPDRSPSPRFGIRDYEWRALRRSPRRRRPRSPRRPAR